MTKREQALEKLYAIHHQSDEVEVKSLAQEALNIDPSCWEAAIILSRSSDFSTRAQVLRSCINENKKLSEEERLSLPHIYKELALVYVEEGRYNLAEVALRNCLQVNPQDKLGARELLCALQVIRETPQADQMVKALKEKELQTLFIRMLYAYKKDDILALKNGISVLHEQHLCLSKILTSSEEELTALAKQSDFQVALQFLRQQSYLVNAVPGFLPTVRRLLNLL